ncbi:MAG: zinc-dependent alcohol dehydrogenase [Anaerolineales bacterium]
MKQARMVEPKTLEIREVMRPEPEADEVLVAVRRIGVCGSDIHVYHGEHPYTSYPVVQGHEVSGEIVEVGDKVEGLQVGDRVTWMPQIVCGECYPCTHGMYHICENLKVMGFQAPGAAQEYFAVQGSKVLAVPEGVSFDAAALIEPIAVAVHALRRSGEALAGKQVLVLGAGTIGNLVAQVARASGAASVMVTDISDYKVEQARACGIDVAVNTAREDLGEALREHFGPSRADLILECVGVQETITRAVEEARKGTTIVVVGVFGERPEVDLGLVQDRELSLVGTLMYQRRDYERAIELVAAGALVLEPLVTHRFPLVSYAKAYATIEESDGRYLKVMIEVGEDG